MKKTVIILFCITCIFSTFFIPRIVYGAFGYFSGKESDVITDDKETITYDEAKALKPWFATDPEKKYKKYIKFRDTYYSKPFWLTYRRDTLDKGLTSEDRE